MRTLIRYVLKPTIVCKCSAVLMWDVTMLARYSVLNGTDDIVTARRPQFPTPFACQCEI